MEERHDGAWADDRPSVGIADRGRERGDGVRAHRRTERSHRRARVLAAVDSTSSSSCGGEMRVCVVGCGAVGSLFAANLAQLEDVEVWAYDLSQPHVDAINANGLRARRCRGGRGEGARRRADPADLAPVRLRDRGDEGHAHRGRDRSHGTRVSRPARPPRCRTASATRKSSRGTSRGSFAGRRFPPGRSWSQASCSGT